MSFTKKHLQTRKSGMGFIKGATLFFLGMSCVIFMARAFEITPVMNDVKGYFKTLIFTASGDNSSATGITLDGINGDAFFNGKVGIGVDTPASKLHVLDTTSTTLTLECDAGDCNNRIDFIEDGILGLYIRTDETDIAENRIRGVTSIPLIFATNDIERMRIAANGDVGIGTNSPSYPLEVMGTGSFDGICLNGDCRNVWPSGGGGATVPGGITKNIQFNDTGTFSGDSNLVRNSADGYMGIGTDSPSYSLHIKDTTNFAGLLLQGNTMSTLRFGSTGDDRGDIREIKRDGAVGSNLGIYNANGHVATFTTGGNVGIGTANPESQLQINNSDGIIALNNTGLASTMLLNGNSTLYSGLAIINQSGSTAVMNLDTGGSLSLYSRLSTMLTINDLGVGIYNSNPLSPVQLDVASTVHSGHIELINSEVGGDDYSQIQINSNPTIFAGMHVTHHNGQSSVASYDGNLSLFAGGTGLITIETGGDVGLHTPDPTEDFQINDYARIGRDITTPGSTTGGAFLRLNTSHGSDMMEGGPMRSPNIQLNEYNTDTTSRDNRKILGGGSLSFMFSDENVTYNDFLSIANNGRVSIGSTATIEKLNIDGDVYFATGASLRGGSLSDNYQLFLAKNGNVGISKNNPSYELDVNGDVQAGAYYYSSDKRFKTDITSIINPLEKILSLNGYMFTWKATGERDMGVIAQEVEKIFPEIVSTNNEGYKSVEYGNLVAPLIEAIKELNAKVDQQNQEIQSLKQLIQ